ncbi:EpsG family protein [Raoultella ornithinolytica]|uniref:EpsG family protein n=1 Tax=Raoultella ornithinolytica TaxID=54291 RepID=UPI001EF922F0|nr:EpsG family protein [Raoultella ornithinolytica]ULI44111.1 EpsG family protein [Raoultella ornithinolytica]HDT3906317.1 EpsG family protein [Raoultella ornithinolytica]HDX8322165.1 EpsG family protein [Raoultella ornithinolytica]HDX8333837.1 EpsG family protein [Raoultella ornithinolytica]
MQHVNHYIPKPGERSITSKEALIKYFLFLILVPFLTYVVGDKDIHQWNDYFTYLNYYNFATDNEISNVFKQGMDPLFIILMKPFTGIQDGFSVFVIVCAYFTLTLKMSALRNSTDNFFILFILYSSYLLCLHDYVQIRISLALALMAFAIYSVNSRGSKAFLFLLAAFIHLTSLFVIITYIVYHLLGFRKFIILSLFSILFPSLLSMGIISNARLSTYVELASNKEKYYQINIFSSQPILQIIGMLAIAFDRKIRDCVKTYEFGMSVLGVLLFYAFSAVPVLSFRLFELTMFFYTILLSRCFKKSVLIMLISVLYILVGLKNMFFGEMSLLHFFG